MLFHVFSHFVWRIVYYLTVISETLDKDKVKPRPLECPLADMIYTVCVHAHTFFAGNEPLWWFWRFGRAHIIFRINSKLVLPARHYIAGCESVVEDAICYGVPLSFHRISLCHHVVQPVVAFLIWRWCPWDGHCARHIFIEFHRTCWLGFIWSSSKKGFRPNSFCFLRSMLQILTSDSNFNAEGFLSNNVLHNDSVDSTICAFSRRNQKLRLSFCVADGYLFRHRSTILLPGNIRPRRSLQKVSMHANHRFRFDDELVKDPKSW